MEAVVRKNGLIPVVQKAFFSPLDEITFHEHFVEPLSAINITIFTILEFLNYYNLLIISNLANFHSSNLIDQTRI